MKKVSSILLAIDGDHDDDALLAEVESIAVANNARVTILSITEPQRANTERNVGLANLQRWESEIRAKQLKKLVDQLSGKKIDVAVEHSTGKPYLEIIRKVMDSDFDLVIKPAHKEAGLRQLLMAGTDMQLLSLCPKPVWIFQPTANRTLKKIAVAVDLQPDDAERTALVEDLLSWAKQVGTAVGAEIHVIHVWSLYREASLRSGTAAARLIDDMVKNKERAQRQHLYAALERAELNDETVISHLLKGNAKELIPALADDIAVDLLIMGTVGRTGIPGFFIGNTADTVLRSVRCSVLAIKPDKFSTPVEQIAQQRSLSA